MLVLLKREELVNERLCSVIERAGVGLIQSLHVALGGVTLVAWHDEKIVGQIKTWLKVCVGDGTLGDNREALAILMQQLDEEDAAGEEVTVGGPLTDEDGCEAEIPAEPEEVEEEELAGAEIEAESIFGTSWEKTLQEIKQKAGNRWGRA